MPYDPGLAERLSEICPSYFMEDRKMFGGLVWMLHGNMCVGIIREWLIIRVGTDAATEILQTAHTKPMDFTGKVMKGWVMVGPDGVSCDSEMEKYVQLAVDFVMTLPAKG